MKKFFDAVNYRKQEDEEKLQAGESCSLCLFASGKACTISVAGAKASMVLEPDHVCDAFYSEGILEMAYEEGHAAGYKDALADVNKATESYYETDNMIYDD